MHDYNFFLKKEEKKHYSLRMKHLRSILCLAILALSLCTSTRARAQVVGVKTNLLYDATATFNLRVEEGIAARISTDSYGNFNNLK